MMIPKRRRRWNLRVWASLRRPREPFRVDLLSQLLLNSNSSSRQRLWWARTFWISWETQLPANLRPQLTSNLQHRTITTSSILWIPPRSLKCSRFPPSSRRLPSLVATVPSSSVGQLLNSRHLLLSNSSRTCSTTWTLTRLLSSSSSSSNKCHSVIFNNHLITICLVDWTCNLMHHLLTISCLISIRCHLFNNSSSSSLDSRISSSHNLQH
jgi:hypothetical protein